MDSRPSGIEGGTSAPPRSFRKPQMRRRIGPPWESFFEPFLLRYDRHDEHVIVFLADHPEYEAIEAMVTRRPGLPPFIRSILSRRGGFQVDHVSEPSSAHIMSALLTDRRTVHRPCAYSASTVNGVPEVRLCFASYRGEDIVLTFKGLGAPDAKLGGLIDPGAHAGNSSLPLMWAGESTHAAPESSVVIGATSYMLGNPALPHPIRGAYTRDFRIGVVRAGHLELRQTRAPRRLEVDESWVYQDHLGNKHRYEILAVGEVLTLRRRSSSSTFPDEILEATLVDDRLALRSIRVTGRRAGEEVVPSAPAGLTLDLSQPGRFSISLDHHPSIVSGSVFMKETDTAEVWTLDPTDPRWATSRTVRSVLARAGDSATLDSEVGAR
ncbi:hypothetical protein [Chondromyces apiculatus]|uniref:Uncharacterized protein n=1 Tax=Chondromyces apiculatus DSM 436 TaxID=1192034 RepID=A0A017TEF1_9BACT|nr:hypothetical protein [Chondromyces apiculatus]EYF07663.1 Hypothetical protein CAP_8164 [Chondromyces apiculatus DSM 436]